MSKIPSIALNFLVYRQTPDSAYSHFEGPWQELQARVVAGFAGWQPGYRDGVRRVPLTPEGFMCSIVDLTDGDQLIGTYRRRSPNEEPRKSVGVVGIKQPALFVDAILYRHDVLAENNEQTTDAAFEVVTFLARRTLEPTPMDPETLMANHFQVSGGTATLMDDTQFVAALRESFMFWRSRALCKPM